MRGKKVRHDPDHVAIDYVDIPMEFLKFHTYVTLVADLISGKNTPFLIIMSRDIIFITVEHIPTVTAE